MKRDINLKKIIFSLIGFIIFWTIITDAWGYSNFIFNGSEIGTYIYGYVSRIIWVIPALVLIFKYSDNLKYNKKELFSRPKFSKSFFMVLLIIVVYVILNMYLNHKGFWFNNEVILGLLVIKYVIVGIVEEFVFRGWGYNSLANVLSNKKSIIVSSILFALLHFPAYFIKFLRFGNFDFMGMIIQGFSTLIMGVIFCLILKKEKSIWNPVIIHTVYDLLFILFVGGN